MTWAMATLAATENQRAWRIVGAVVNGYACGYERGYPHPVRDRAGRSACRRATLAARLRRVAQAGGSQACPGEAGADTASNGAGARGLSATRWEPSTEHKSPNT